MSFPNMGLPLRLFAALSAMAGLVVGQEPTFTDANWVAFGTNFSAQSLAPVGALAVDPGGTVYAGGLHGYDPGVTQLMGTQWNRLPPGPFEIKTATLGGITALCVDHSGVLYVGGAYVGIDTSTPFLAEWSGSEWVSLGNILQCDLFGGLYAIAVDSSNHIYIAGRFCQMVDPSGTTQSTGSIAAWNGTNWSAVGSGSPLNGAINALAIGPNDTLYAGGYFNMIDGVAATNIAKWDGQGWSALAWGLGNNSAPLSGVKVLAVDSFGTLYAGGSFTNAGSLRVSNIAKWDGTQWSALGNETDGSVQAMALDPGGNLYAGGAFTRIGGVVANNIARWDGHTWSALGSGVTGFNSSPEPSVNALAFDPSGNLYVGGFFTNAGAQVSTWLAKVLVSPQSSRLQATFTDPGTNEITGWGTPGVTYVLEATTNVMPPIQWTAVATNIPTSQRLVFTNSTSQTQRFYRMRSWY